MSWKIKLKNNKKFVFLLDISSGSSCTNKSETSCMDKSKTSYSKKVKQVVLMKVKPVFLDGSENICSDGVGYCCFFFGSFEIISFMWNNFRVFMLIFKLQLVKICF